MKALWIFISTLFLTVSAFAQTDLQKLVDTEHAFAAIAAEKGARAAFLENLADDGLVFNPDKVNGKALWSAKPEASYLLSWAPNYADISSNGILGYTTGNWEYRAKGKDDAPSAFGDFVTVWLRQPSGKFKFVIDIGVGHAKPDKYLTEWTTSADNGAGKIAGDSAASEIATEFYQLATARGIVKAYETYAADDIRVYREDKFLILGKKNFRSLVSRDKAVVTFAKRGVFFSSADLAYSTNAYTRFADGKIVEKGNFMQIWKLRGGKWHIVLDIFKPIPPEK